MDRRTFLEMAFAAPALGQAAAARPPVKARVPAPAPAPAAVPAPVGVPWTQWGGPRRNFQTEASGITDVWPAAGPRVVWKRPRGVIR